MLSRRCVSISQGSSVNGAIRFHCYSGFFYFNWTQRGAKKRFFFGLIDEFAIYDKVLPAARLLAHYHAAAGRKSILPIA